MPVPTAGDRVPTVLEDPSGNRARWLRRAGRVVFLVFLAWLVAIVLGGLGLLPVAGIPLTHALRPSLGPPPLVKPLRPRPPSVSDLRPALPAATRTPPLPHGKSAVAPGRTKTTTTHGKSSVAPGRTKTAKTTTTTHGKSTVAPGRTKTTTTTHGKKP